MRSTASRWSRSDQPLPNGCCGCCRRQPTWMITTSVTFASCSPRAGPSWWQDTPQPRLAPLQLLAALLAEAPERLPLPLRSRSFGEPCPEAVALAAEAQQLDNRLPPGHPARQLYTTLRDQAHAAIASAKEIDGAPLEG